MLLDQYNKIPKCFVTLVEEYGNPSAQAPLGGGNNKRYVSAWHNNWLIVRLYDQWRYAHAQAIGKDPAKRWFWRASEYSPTDWKTTVMREMNAEYAGNASYEWFEWRPDSNGQQQMYRVNQFDRIENTDDPRVQNPALEFMFANPDLTVRAAAREFKRSLEKKN